MKLTKSASLSSSSKKLSVRLGWMVALALIAGMTIGAVGTWLLAERVDQLKTDITKTSAREPFVLSPASDAKTVTPTEEIVAPKDVMPSEVREAYAKARAFASSDVVPGDVSVDWIEAQEVTSTKWGEIFGGVATSGAIQKFSVPQEDYSEYHVWLAD